ncbi:putative drug transporter [Streptomyces sp. NBRC 110611]|uniref:MFS transporter n=1 Tax=Streptomyces sp. NBRC 110611 TaxID=1621259 RepID=UPI00082BB8A1|nr:MFS transporter [Streptomyces sp. NBRC 110611]GAU68339.1 putative drug transporter [Streptomyces sp. NBRC 110611]
MILISVVAIMGHTALPTPIYAIYSREFGLTTLQVTEVYAIYALGVIAALVLFNSLSNTIGRRPLLMIGLVCSIASNIVFLNATSIAGLFAARSLTGLAAGLFMGTATVAAVEVAPASIAKNSAVWATAANILGLGVGPVAGGLGAQFFDAPQKTLFVLHLVLICVISVLMLVIREPLAKADRVPFVWSTPKPPSAHRRTYTGLTLIGVSGMATLGMLAGLTPHFLTTFYPQASGLTAGLVVGGAFGGSALAQLAFRRLTIARGLGSGVCVMSLGLLVLIGAVAFGSGVLYTSAALLAGLGQGLTIARSVQEISLRTALSERVSAVNLYYVALYTGAAIPVIALAFIERSFGLTAAGVAFCLFALVFAATGTLQLSRSGMWRKEPAVDSRPETVRA